MAIGETTATLFELVISAETKARDFFVGLAEKFSHLPEVSSFWQGMAKDELEHARELENIRDSLTRNELLLPADPDILCKTKRISEFSVEDQLESVQNLEDAYKLAHDAEYSEVNAALIFLTKKFMSSEQRKEFVLSRLQSHLGKLMDFGYAFGKVERMNTSSRQGR